MPFTDPPSAPGSPCDPPLEGDANLDGRVDVLDLNEVALNWQMDVGPGEPADFNGDGRVDAADLNIVGLHWQEGCD